MTIRRWPAEWEPHAGTWLAWPHNPDTWPGHLAEAQGEFVGFVRALAARETVRLLVADEAMADAVRRELAAAGVPVEDVELVPVPTDDAWLRDTGPILVEEEGRQVALDFTFDAWGGKYPPWERDARVAGRLAEIGGFETRTPGFVLEGGSIDGNGRGCVLTTEACLLHPNREAGRTREQMEARLGEWLGASQVLWLADGIVGDDTDGHIDDIARFVAPDVVVAATADPSDGPNSTALSENLRRLRGMRDQDGKPLHVATLPMPPPHRVGNLLCPASYANFYLANSVALVPVFGAPSDQRALDALGEVLPDRDVIGVPCRTLVMGLGAWHCLSQQVPAGGRSGAGIATS